MWMYIWFEVWNSVCWNDGSVKIVAGPSDHQGKGFSGTDNNLAGQGPRSGAYFEDWTYSTLLTLSPQYSFYCDYRNPRMPTLHCVIMGCFLGMREWKLPTNVMKQRKLDLNLSGK